MGEHQFLAIREELKEKYRKKLRENREITDKITSLVDDQYDGNFFGPSETVLATRLIKETDTLFEKLSSSNSKSSFCSNDKDSSKKMDKVQKIKESRDYSFLLSENQDLKSKPIPLTGKISPSDNGQKLDSDKRVSVSKPVAKKEETLKNRSHRPKGLPPSKTSPVKVVQHRKKSELEPTIRRKPTDVEKKKKQCQNSEKRASPTKPSDVKKAQPLWRNSEKRASPTKPTDVKKAEPLSRNSKKRPLREISGDLEDDRYEGEKAISMVRKMFNTQRFAGRDDSDRMMEASFGDIVKEEKRSERLAKKEDEEQLRLILEEDEKFRQKAKKQRQPLK